MRIDLSRPREFGGEQLARLLKPFPMRLILKDGVPALE
jgi:hypothetical protein